MKQSITPKSFLIIAAIVSGCCFLFVNIHAVWSNPAGIATSTELIDKDKQPAVEQDDEDTANLPVPDVTVVERIFNLAQRLVGRG